ncbi:hypothetical protein GCM10020220_077460 [Nonomuraea rubra]
MESLVLSEHSLDVACAARWLSRVCVSIESRVLARGRAAVAPLLWREVSGIAYARCLAQWETCVHRVDARLTRRL